MGDDPVHSKHNKSITQWQQLGRQKEACWYIDMEADAVVTTPEEA